MTAMDPEMRRRINTNLRELADGTVARREAAKKAMKTARKEQDRIDRKRLKVVAARIIEVTTERDGLQEYMDSMLEGSEEWVNGIDETDHAIEGCTNEIVALMQEADELRAAIGD